MRPMVSMIVTIQITPHPTPVFRICGAYFAAAPPAASLENTYVKYDKKIGALISVSPCEVRQEIAVLIHFVLVFPFFVSRPFL